MLGGGRSYELNKRSTPLLPSSSLSLVYLLLNKAKLGASRVVEKEEMVRKEV